MAEVQVVRNVGTDRCSLVYENVDGEKSFAVRLHVEAEAADVRAPATTVASCDADAGGYVGTAEGMRADGEWWLVVRGQRKKLQRKHVSPPLDRDDII
jgi:hypothetical protein